MSELEKAHAEFKKTAKEWSLAYSRGDTKAFNEAKAKNGKALKKLKELRGW